MAKGIELTGDQLEAFAGGRDLGVVDDVTGPISILDLNTGAPILEGWSRHDAIELVKATMSSGDKLYTISYDQYIDWLDHKKSRTIAHCGVEADQGPSYRWVRKYAESIKENLPIYISP